MNAGKSAAPERRIGLPAKVFVVVNLALIRIRPARPEAPFRVPGFVPFAGVLLRCAALGHSLWSLL